MLSIRTALVVLALCVTVALVHAQNRDFGAVVSNLPQLQHTSGGFLSSAGEPSLGATTDALFLANLYGITGLIDSAAVPGFIRSCEKNDGGYGPNAQADKSDVQSTRVRLVLIHHSDAVFAFLHLDLEIPNEGSIARYIDGLRDPASGMFAPSVGAAPGLDATVVALETLRALGNTDIISSVSDELRSMLGDADSGTAFSFGGPVVSDEYSGVKIAAAVKYSFDYYGHVTALSDLQRVGGGWPSTDADSSATVLSTSRAAAAVHELSALADRRFSSFVNLEKLRHFLSVIPFSLSDAADAHRAVAMLNFPDLIRTKVAYEPSPTSPAIRNKAIIEGSSVRPVLHAGAFGQNHLGLDVSIKYTLGEETFTLDMPFVSTRYATETLVNFENYLGPARFAFLIKLDNPEIGEIVFQLDDTMTVGYGIDVIASARHELSGREVLLGETVSEGTSFQFEVTLVTADSPSTTTGDFSLEFSVLDSAAVPIFTESHDCRSGGDIAFAYTLETTAIPTGALYFQFTVNGEDGKPHSMEVVQYQYDVPMVATNIKFIGAHDGSFRLGSTATIEMTPAAFSDLSTPEPLLQADATRSFFLDMYSQAGVRLASYPGNVGSDGSVTFSQTVASAFDSIGTSVVSFRFEGADEKSYTLSNFNSDAGELFDDGAVTFTVASELTADVPQGAIESKLQYGDEISFEVNVIDALSGEEVKRGNEANLYLVLNHEDSAGNAYTSVKQPAAKGDTGLKIEWVVDPNAVAGNAFFTLVAEDPAGEQHVLSSTEGDALRFDVEIGGEIEVSFNGYSKAIEHSRGTVFFVEFSLSCADKPLSGARLSVQVGDSEDVIPVASADESYTVSWMTPHHVSPSGDYAVRVFRDVDRARAAELDAEKLKAARQLQREKELQGEAVDDEVEIEHTVVEPLFERTITHVAPSTFKSPIRTQWLALFVFGFVFYKVYGFTK